MISAIILAAGLSRRMKIGNKLLLKINKYPIISITLDKIKASNVNEIILILGNDYLNIKNIIKEKNIKIYINSNYRSGISSSIIKGLQKVNKLSEGALICLADMPLIKTSTYNIIIDAFYKNNKKNIIPYYNKTKGNPVLFNKNYFKDLINIKGDYGAKHIIENNKEDFAKISVYDKGVLEDIDNASQYYNYVKNKNDY